MKIVIQKNKKNIIFMLLLLAIIALVYISSKVQEVPYNSYIGLSNQTIEKIENSKRGEEVRALIERTPGIEKTTIKQGGDISHTIYAHTRRLEQILIDVVPSEKESKLKVTIQDKNSESVYSDNYTVDKNDDKIILNISTIPYVKLDDLLVKIEVLESTSGITLYTYTDNDASKSTEEQVPRQLLVNLKGTLEIHKDKSIFLLSSIVILLLASLLYQFREKLLFQKLSKIINRKKIIAFGTEAVVFFMLLLAFLKFYTEYIYYQQVDFLVTSLVIIIGGIFIAIVVDIFNTTAKESVADTFVLLAIPIGLSFLIFMLPDQVPDEYVHYAKAYLTSNFKVNAGNSVSMSVDYMPFKLVNYNDIFPALFNVGNYNELVTQNNACSYNFLLYIPSAVGILFAKILHLSVYFGYYFGRCINLGIYIYVGYRCIKMIPVGKYIFFVYMLNPMAIHQAASFSTDGLVNSFVLLSIAYFLKLWYVDEEIKDKDIFIICSLIFVVVMAKYSYLPVFGIYLILYKRILQITKKQVLLLLCGLSGVVLLYLFLNTIVGEAGVIASQQKHMLAAGVDVSGQIKYMLENPVATFNMLCDTLITKKVFYYQSFMGLFAWLSIPLHYVAAAAYGGLLLISPLVIEEKKSFKITQRLWIVIIGSINVVLVIIGMYLFWTGVGASITEGVQGRYFIPIIILFLLAYSGPKKIIFKNPMRFFSIIILLINGCAIISILQFFS